MRKIKDNGRTLKLVKRKGRIHGCCGCEKPDINQNHCIASMNMKECGTYIGHWRETLPSKLSRLIKRMVNK